MSAGRHHGLGLEGVLIDQQIPDLPFLADLEIGLMGVEVARHLGVARADLRPEAVGRQADHRQLHLVVAAAIFLFELLLRHRDPVGQRRAQLFDGQLTTDVFLELGAGQRRPLRAQQLGIALFADELAVLLERGNRENALSDFLVADANLEPIGFGDGGALVDHLLQDLLFDAQLFEQLVVHLSAVRGPVRLQLSLVDPAELARGDVLALDGGHGSARGRVGAGASQEIGDVENHERQAHQEKAPLEPAPVPPHSIEHGHGNTLVLSELRSACVKP